MNAAVTELTDVSLLFCYSLFRNWCPKYTLSHLQQSLKVKAERFREDFVQIVWSTVPSGYQFRNRWWQSHKIIHTSFNLWSISFTYYCTVYWPKDTAFILNIPNSYPIFLILSLTSFWRIRTLHRSLWVKAQHRYILYECRFVQMGKFGLQKYRLYLTYCM